MAVRFITGAAGTGKSRYCIEAVKNAICDGSEAKTIFLVPEQATYQIERQILADQRIDGYSNAYILSFSRLGFWLSQRQTSLEPLSKTAKYMIISRVLREHKDKLKVFGSMTNEPGMIKKISDVISELYRCGKSGADLLELAKSGENNLSLSAKISLEKFADIALIHDEYVDFLTGRFENPDAELDKVCSMIAGSEIFRGCNLWVDGFSGFTHTEYQVLCELLKVCRCAEIALCVPSEEDYRSDMFSPAIETMTKIEQLVRENNIEMLEPIKLGENHRTKAPDLKHLEKNIFTSSDKIKTENIKIVSPLNIGDEVEYIASQINELVFEDGLRYRDIAVISSDIDTYEPYIRQIFGDYKLPFFIDSRRCCTGHPLIKMLLSAIKVIEKGFERVDVFSYLKTGFTNADNSEIALLEKYCRRKGVDKAKWLSEQKWNCENIDLDIDPNTLDKTRKKAMKEILWLNSLINGKLRADEFADILFEFISKLKIEQKLESRNDSRSEDNQVYSQVIDVLGEIKTIFGQDRLDSGILLASLSDALIAISSALIPPGQDEVMVSQIERSRHPELKAVFVAGALANKFPINISESSILSDFDRDFAADKGCELEEGCLNKIDKRHYLAYIALTRASQRLWITYPRTASDGKNTQPSDIVGEVVSLFDNLQSQTDIIHQTPDKISVINRLKDYICINAGRNSYAKYYGKDLEPLIEALKQDCDLCEAVAALDKAFQYNNIAMVESDIGSFDEKKRLQLSISKLECYATCPYKYFAKYALKLKEEEKPEYTPLNKGNFYHNVLQLVSDELIKNGCGFAEVSIDELKKITYRKIENVIEQTPEIADIANSSRHNEFIFNMMKKDIFEFLRSLRDMAKVSDFKLKFSELNFKDDFIIKISDAKEAAIQSKIDRIDIADANLAVVYDYKSSKKVMFDWEGLFNALDLQLPAYVLCVNSAGGDLAQIKAVAALKIPIAKDNEAKKQKDEYGELLARKARGFYDENYARNLDNSIEKGEKSCFYAIGLKKDGGFNQNSSGDLLSSQQFKQLIDFTKQKMTSLSECILESKIPIKPYKRKSTTACGTGIYNCCYKPLCRFDREINDYRILETFPTRNKKKDFFEKCEQGALV